MFFIGNIDCIKKPEQFNPNRIPAALSSRRAKQRFSPFKSFKCNFYRWLHIYWHGPGFIFALHWFPVLHKSMINPLINTLIKTLK